MVKRLVFLLALCGFIAAPVWHAALAQETQAQRYICPMHPQVSANEVGKCPICGMDLVLQGGAPHVHNSDKKTITVSAEALQKSGVRTQNVEKTNFGKTLRTSGLVTVDIRRLWHLMSMVEGRMEEQNVLVGEKVTKDRPFYSLSSSKLIAVQGQYISALDSGDKKRITAAVTELQSLGIDQRVIDQVGSTKTIMRKVPFYAPFDGVVTTLNFANGHMIIQGREIGHAQNTDVLLLEAQLSQEDIQLVAAGDKGVAHLAGVAKPYDVTIENVSSIIDPRTHFGKVRIAIDNKDGALRPDQYAEVEIKTQEKPRLSVPHNAVLRTAAGDHVVKALGDGRFQSVVVRTGIVSGDKTEIIDGLSEGDAVVVNGQFMLDSESLMRDAVQ
jgi:membrane fusion protein, copper/silver efflux system